MNPWPFVIAAYALTLVGAAVLSVASFRAMRSAERRADAFRRDRRD
jgi:hypothetical protein